MTTRRRVMDLLRSYVDDRNRAAEEDREQIIHLNSELVAARTSHAAVMSAALSKEAKYRAEIADLQRRLLEVEKRYRSRVEELEQRLDVQADEQQLQKTYGESLERRIQQQRRQFLSISRALRWVHLSTIDMSQMADEADRVHADHRRLTTTTTTTTEDATEGRNEPLALAFSDQTENRMLIDRTSAAMDRIDQITTDPQAGRRRRRRPPTAVDDDDSRRVGANQAGALIVRGEDVDQLQQRLYEYEMETSQQGAPPGSPEATTTTTTTTEPFDQAIGAAVGTAVESAIEQAIEQSPPPSSSSLITASPTTPVPDPTFTPMPFVDDIVDDPFHLLLFGDEQSTAQELGLPPLPPPANAAAAAAGSFNSSSPPPSPAPMLPLSPRLTSAIVH